MTENEARTEDPRGAKAQELAQEAGEPVGPMPPAPVSSEDVPPDEIRVHGTHQLSMFKTQGKRPTSSSVTFIGGKVQLVDGEAYAKGEVLRVRGLALVVGEGAQDSLDTSTQSVVSCERQHRARWRDLEVSAASLPEVITVSRAALDTLGTDGRVEVATDFGDVVLQLPSQETLA